MEKFHWLKVVKQHGQGILITILLTVIITAGCKSGNSLVEMESAEEQLVSTEPVRIIEPTIAERGWPEQVLYYQNIAVEHDRLYLEGPFEKSGREDGYFRTWDYDSTLAAGASPAIFVGNTFILPISVIIEPPWQKQYSRSDYPIAAPAYELPGEPSGMAQLESKR